MGRFIQELPCHGAIDCNRHGNLCQVNNPVYLTFIFMGLAAAGRWGALDNKRDGERFAHSFAGVGHGGGT
jgi:hypothetical protein